MIIAVNVGNSNILIGAGTPGGEIVYRVSAHSDPAKTADEYALLFSGLLKNCGSANCGSANAANGANGASVTCGSSTHSAEDFDGAVMSSVTDALTPAVTGALERLTGSEPVIVGPGVKTGLNIKIDNPAQLGSDMACASVGALSRYSPPLLVLTMGTATVFIFIDRNGVLQGTSIAPGIDISLRELSARCAQLPLIGADTSPSKLFGANTVDSMRSGIYYGVASMIDGIADRAEEMAGCSLKIVAAGKRAAAVTPYCRRNVILEPDLILLGLLEIYRKNRRSPRQ